MKLTTYIDLKHRGNRAAFARLIGVSAMSVLRYCKEPPHIPRPSIMVRIVALTNGEVTPNDFFCAAYSAKPQTGKVRKKRKQLQTKE